MIAWLLLVLLVTVDGSAQVSIMFDRGMAWWSPWLLKVGPLCLADLFLIFLTGYTLVRLMTDARITWPVSRYSWILGLTLVYLALGVLYNLAVYTAWKPFLYDFKCFLYLAAPYLFLHVCAHEDFPDWFRPEWIFGLHTVSVLIDFGLVSLLGHSDLPSLTAFPGLPCLAMPAVTITGLFYAPSRRGRMAFLALLIVEAANAVNRVAGFYLAATLITPLYMGAVLVSRRLLIRYVAVLTLVVGYHALWIIMIVSPPHLPLVEAKADGVVTRAIQLQNLAINFNENIPGWIGKGLGSTWFEHVPVPAEDIYSVGTSLGESAAESLDQPVKFIFNTPAAAILYKWGVIGILLQVFLITLCYSYWESKLDRISQRRPDHPRLPMLRGALMIGFLIALDTVLFVGMLQLSLSISLLMFYVERQTQRIYQETVEAQAVLPASSASKAVR